MTAKKSLKIFRDNDNFRIRSRISPELINISKTGKALDHSQPLPSQAKKIGILWSTNEKVIDRNNESACLRVGPRFKNVCSSLTTSDGRYISWVDKVRYLGIHLVSVKTFSCLKMLKKHITARLMVYSEK